MRTSRSIRVGIALALATLIAILTAPTVVPADAAAAVVQPERATDHTIRVVTYNVGDKDRDRLLTQLTGLVRTQRPHVIGLQEVADRDGLLRAAARRTGYELVRASGTNAVEHNALLVAPPAARVLASSSPQMHGTETVHPQTPGTGSGDTVPPKYVNAVRVRVDGLDWAVGTVHLVPSASRFARNEALHGREVRFCARWLRTRSNEPVIMGDWNAEPGTRRRPGLMAGLRQVARPFSRPSFEDGRSIDHVWARRDARGTVRALRGYGGDHRPVLATLTVTR